MKVRVALLATLGIISLALVGQAHEFWLTVRWVEAQALVEAWVGEGYRGEARHFHRARTRTLEARPPQGEAYTIVQATFGPGVDSVAAVRVPLWQAGAHLVAYESEPSFIELDTARFHAYLREDGLERIITERARRGELAKPGRERYSRCAVAVVVPPGTPPSARQLHQHWRGLSLELRLDSLPAGPGPVSIRLNYLAKPKGQVKVVAWHRDGDQLTRHEGRTDGRGRVLLPLDRPGRWLISAVHMVRLDAYHPERGDGADWRSYWASLTFDVPAKP